MSRNEAQFWSAVVRPRLSPFGKLVRIENVLEEGTPDVSYTLCGVGGWLELKNVDDWPVRSETIVRVEHYTPAQRQWHVGWCAAGGKCFVAVRVCGHGTLYDDDLSIAEPRAPDEFFIFRGDVAAEVVGRTPAAVWYSTAAFSGTSFNSEAVARVLTGLDSVRRLA